MIGKPCDAGDGYAPCDIVDGMCRQCGRCGDGESAAETWRQILEEVQRENIAVKVERDNALMSLSRTRAALERAKEERDEFKSDRNKAWSEAAEREMEIARLLAGNENLRVELEREVQRAADAYNAQRKLLSGLRVVRRALHRQSELGCTCYSDPEGDCAYCNESNRMSAVFHALLGGESEGEQP